MSSSSRLAHFAGASQSSRAGLAKTAEESDELVASAIERAECQCRGEVGQKEDVPQTSQGSGARARLRPCRGAQNQAKQTRKSVTAKPPADMPPGSPFGPGTVALVTYLHGSQMLGRG